jgi:hypothetical protein
MQAIFGAVPGAMTFIAGGFANKEEAIAEIKSGDINYDQFEWLAIIPAHMILVETLPKPADKYDRALEILDLRPSELEALAREVAESVTNEVGCSDHKLIDAIKRAYAANTGEDMSDPYP